MPWFVELMIGVKSLSASQLGASKNILRLFFDLREIDQNSGNSRKLYRNISSFKAIILIKLIIFRKVKKMFLTKNKFTSNGFKQEK